MCAKKDHASIGIVSSHNFPPTTQIHCWTNTPFTGFPFLPFHKLLFVLHHAFSHLFVPRQRLTSFFLPYNAPFPILCHTRSQWFVSNLWFPQWPSFFGIFFFFFFFRSQRWEPSSHLGLPRRLRSHQKNRKRQIFRSIRWYECGEQWKVCR